MFYRHPYRTSCQAVSGFVQPFPHSDIMEPQHGVYEANKTGDRKAEQTIYNQIGRPSIHGDSKTEQINTHIRRRGLQYIG